MDGKRLFFRDIHKMCDGFEEPFLDKVCTGWQALVVTAKRADGTAAAVRFEEGRIVVSGAGTLDAEYADGAFRKGVSAADGGVDFTFQGFRYRVPVRGDVKSTAKGFSISGGRIELDLSR